SSAYIGRPVAASFRATASHDAELCANPCSKMSGAADGRAVAGGQQTLSAWSAQDEKVVDEKPAPGAGQLADAPFAGV
ncbi:MAG: hypothetical protein UCO86_08365, partial [Eggerthella lenta]|nr:hypothetical protein [Eggerthella lenta]